MIKQILIKLSSRPHSGLLLSRQLGSSIGNGSNKDDRLLKEELSLHGIHLDDIDKIMSDGEPLPPINQYYPKLDIVPSAVKDPFKGHNLVVIQPWVSYANFNEFTDPELQLAECVSLGNTIKGWNVIGKKIVFSHHINRRQLVGPKSFGELKDLILSYNGVSAVFFGVELLSGVQLATLEKELKMPVYDRFTMVLNIFRHHARTREAKVQLALAELPYIRSHLREIHESSEYSSSAESLKILIGGAGESFYHQRLNTLKRRERKLKEVLGQIRKQRELSGKQRRKSDWPVVSVVGYTNSGKTSLVKYFSHDEDLVPKDELFATLDVTAHPAQLPSSKNVFFVDTVGFLSRIPLLLIEAFSATLKDVRESDLIVHILDVTHPDHRLQYSTVIKALETLNTPKRLLESRLTIGNKVDLLQSLDASEKTLPKCDLHVSATKGINLDKLVDKIDRQLISNLRHDTLELRVENGGNRFMWLRKNATIVECKADETNFNYLICRVIMSPAALGRWSKHFGAEGVPAKPE